MISVATGRTICQDTTQKLFYNFDVEDPLLENRSYDYLYCYVTQKNRAFYKDGFLKPTDRLYYQMVGTEAVHAVPMSNLMICAVQEYFIQKIQFKTVYFGCKQTGATYELSAVELDNGSDYHAENLYAYKSCKTEKEISQLAFITMYNTRYHKIDQYLKASES